MRSVGVEIGDVLPDEPRAVRLLNTVWAGRDGPHDDLATTAQSDAWLRRAGCRPPGRLTREDAAALRSLRDALRRLAAHRTVDPRERSVPASSVTDALERVNAVAGAPVPGPQLSLHGSAGLERLAQPPRDVTDVLHVLAREGVEALAGPEALPLRACLAPSCVLYYVQDHPRRAWCSAACGNRARAARHYARTREAR